MKAQTAPGAHEARTSEWTILDRLRKSRRAAGFSQIELARIIGVARNTVSNYEAGATPPRRPVLLSWAMACHVSLEWLQGDDFPTPPPAPTTDTKVTFSSILRAVGLAPGLHSLTG